MSTQTFVLASLIISIVSLAVSIWGIWSGGKTKAIMKIFGSDNRPDNLEEVLASITEMIRKLKSDQTELQNFTQSQSEILQTAFRYSSVVRYNSTGTDGGNLSFSLALLDGNQSGFIITSLHGRENNRIYSKEITQGQSLSQLSEEERQAIMAALTINNSKTKVDTKNS